MATKPLTGAPRPTPSRAAALPHSSARSTLQAGLIRLASQCDVRVLISGARGDERLAIARAIHHGSARGRHPFVVVDASRWRDGGWRRQCAAVIEGAMDGTAFVDNVSADAVPALDAIVNAGGPRLIAGAAPGLYASVEAGTFPVTVFYRLNVIHIRVD